MHNNYYEQVYDNLYPNEYSDMTYNQTYYNQPFENTNLNRPNFQNIGTGQMSEFQSLKRPTLRMLNGVVNYGMRSINALGVKRAMRRVAIISYLMGRGFSENIALTLANEWD